MRSLTMIIVLGALLALAGCGRMTTPPDAATPADSMAPPDASACLANGAMCNSGEECCSGGCAVGTLTCG
jgi:hypothetical protein